MSNEIDIQEDDIMQLDEQLLNVLLKDHTRSTEQEQHNIFWATTQYEYLGKGYGFNDEILPSNITGEHGHVIMPRVLKDQESQKARSKDMAEVFTPSWVCNAQNNLIDSSWFGRMDVFNHENDDCTWTDQPNKIVFPEGKTWKDYVRDRRLEITCGEAPYLVSRYDTTTGEPLPLQHRIGLLDRKLRVISENVDNSRDWLKAAQRAYKSTYAYEWQGDSLLLAREAMLYTFIDYYRAKFGKTPMVKSIVSIAYIISWNVWQMDGLKGVVPCSCKPQITVTKNFYGDDTIIETPCTGCKGNDIRHHNGTYCYIREWKKSDSKIDRIKFIDTIK